MKALVQIIQNNNLENKYSSDDLEKIRYASRTIIGEVVKFLLLLVYSVIVADFISFLYITIPLMTLRPFSGGLHFKSHISCFLFSLLFYSSIIFIPQTLISYGLALLLFLLSLTIIAVYSPVSSAKRPSYSKEKQKLFRTIAVLFVFVCMMFYFIKPNEYMNLVLLTICFQALQLLIAKEVKVYVSKSKQKK